MEIIFTAETYQTAGNLFIQAKQEIDIGIKAVAKNDYGEEFKSMAVIPIIMPKDLHEKFRERRLIKRKTFEADIRLFVDFEKFVKGKWDVKKEPYRTERKLLLVKNIVNSIMVVESRKKGDFQGEKLIHDILQALDVRREDLEKL